MRAQFWGEPLCYQLCGADKFLQIEDIDLTNMSGAWGTMRVRSGTEGC